MQYEILNTPIFELGRNQYHHTTTERHSPAVSLSLSLSLDVGVCVCVPEKLRQLNLAGPTPDLCACVYVCICVYVGMSTYATSQATYLLQCSP